MQITQSRHRSEFWFVTWESALEKRRETVLTYMNCFHLGLQSKRVVTPDFPNQRAAYNSFDDIHSLKRARSTLTPALIFAVTYYFVAVIFFAGILWKIISYARIPVKNFIPIAPVPATRFAMLARITREVLFFESLFRASKWTWIFGWVFHYALLIVLIRHLFFVTETPPSWLVWIFTPSDIAAWMMALSLFGLLLRRCAVDRVRYISSPSDYLMLLLLLTIAITGTLLRYTAHHEIFAVREFVLGIIRFSPQNLPSNLILYVHLSSVALFLAVFPFSKLIHFPAYFFSPSHNQYSSQYVKK